jgi:hypothetical protein
MLRKFPSREVKKASLRTLREAKAFLSPASLEAAESAEKEKIYFQGGR